MKIKKISIILFSIILLNACSKPSDNYFSTQSFYMGTVVTQKIYGKNSIEVSRKAEEKIKNIEKVMSINIPDSTVNKINSFAGKGWIDVDENVIFVLKKANYYSQLTNGAFDITVAPLVKLWDVLSDNPKIPGTHKIQESLKSVNYKDLLIDEKNLKVKLNIEGQMIDLGGIAKGYAADEVKKVYEENGIKSGIINLGGNIITLGKKSDNQSWRVGIQNPRGETGEYIGTIEADGKSVVSSGDYQRYFEKNGTRYHHIIDPKTGYPADSGLISTTIISLNSIDADALSTATFVLGLEKGIKLIEDIDGIEGIFVTKDKKVYVTEGLKNNFVFEDKSGEFSYVKKGR